MRSQNRLLNVFWTVLAAFLLFLQPSFAAQAVVPSQSLGSDDLERDSSSVRTSIVFEDFEISIPDSNQLLIKKYFRLEHKWKPIGKISLVDSEKIYTVLLHPFNTLDRHERWSAESGAGHFEPLNGCALSQGGSGTRATGAGTITGHEVGGQRLSGGPGDSALARGRFDVLSQKANIEALLLSLELTPVSDRDTDNGDARTRDARTLDGRTRDAGTSVSDASDTGRQTCGEVTAHCRSLLLGDCGGGTCGRAGCTTNVAVLLGEEGVTKQEDYSARSQEKEQLA